ncbi:uncharacterized protein LOC117123178 [Anneissia japonica]|uniref:uncharacterized protein LOC117123178 n=1 Tax=Anneissia japonica TaxID=1529436 RepID=UPI00142566B2|nr:uncharacterized protein LOC117123178 [Anneissia japonica]
MAATGRHEPAARDLLPRYPQPFSVISEHWQDQLHVHDNTGDDLFSFGPVYDENMFKLIHKHLELDTHDRFAYVGASKGSYAAKIKEKFCLLQPIVEIYPGTILYEETPNQRRMIPFKVDQVGAEQYFRELSEGLTEGKEPPFDKIILHGAFEYFSSPKTTFAHIMRTLTKHGKLLILHRPAPMSTLPFFTEANKRFVEEDSNDPYLKILRSLQSQRVDVKWDIEVLPIVMPKVKWLAMLNKKFPPQMEIISNFEILTGVRELTEGMLKYQGEMVEFFDRLMFIAVSLPYGTGGYPSIQRHGSSETKPYPGLVDLKYSLEITPDIQKHIRDIQNNKKFKQNSIF